MVKFVIDKTDYFMQPCSTYPRSKTQNIQFCVAFIYERDAQQCIWAFGG